MSLPHIPLFKVFTSPEAHGALKAVLDSGQLACGPKTREFESLVAGSLGQPNVVAISDASAALTLALCMSGVRPGDEVITSPLACSASLMPIANLFASPVWCDIDPRSGMVDLAMIDRLITDKTRALLVYLWSGDTVEFDLLAALARKHGIKLVIDASEAFGAAWHGRPIGDNADFTVFSFYATKHISCGEGACLVARTGEDAARARLLRRFGIDYAALRKANGDLDPEFDIPVAGYNFQTNEVMATIGVEGMRYADTILSRYRENGLFYETALAGIAGVQRIERCKDSFSGYWTYSLLAERRDELVRKLTASGIGAQRLHLRNDTYKCFGGMRNKLPGIDAFDAMNISIPCGWWVGPDERERIVDILRSGW